MSNKKAITSRSQDYSQWYLDVIEAADLAEYSSVKGCMVIKPYGYAIWENFQKILDQMIKDTGHHNAYFPLFIPKSFLTKEASHVEGFAKECAVVTHYRLKAENGEIIVDSEANLTEELIVRPTSETIMYDTFSRWISSWRDLPLLINQWANVVRWEMRTRPFLRTTEFLWQEGHTAHANYEDAEEEALKMLGVYQSLAEETLAMPVIPGKKSDSEKFAGALHTYTIEAMMQDGKALQAGTSHNLGQNFAKAFEVKFSDENGKLQYVWQTSWGVSTRMIGALIMAHSDDKGLVLPPKIAPIKVVIIPIWKNEEGKEKVLEVAEKLVNELKISIGNIHLERRDYLTMGEKFYEWEKKGVPIRLELGLRELEKSEVIAVRRDSGEKINLKLSDVQAKLPSLLVDIQQSLYQKAKTFLKSNTRTLKTYEEFKHQLNQEIPGFIYASWCGLETCEKIIKEETKASTRCIPLENKKEQGQCIKCEEPTQTKIVFAKAY